MYVEWMWSQCGVDVVWVWCQCGVDVVSVWSGCVTCGVNVEWVWSQCRLCRLAVTCHRNNGFELGFQKVRARINQLRHRRNAIQVRYNCNGFNGVET